jgi:tRNA U34 2-thiouridine synthase MnmA/TrmU
MDLGGRGVETFGLMMRLWSADPKGYNRGCSPEDVALARQIASQLDIPLTLIDLKYLFKMHVVDAHIDGYAHDMISNPCLSCN